MKAGSLATIRYSKGFSSSHVEDDESDFLVTGSRNLLIDGGGQLRAFKGLAALSGSGSSVMFPFGLGTAGLAKSGGNEGKGSVFAGPGLAAIYIGIGDLLIDRVSLATAAATTLALRLLRSGSYTSGGALNGPFTAGLVAPNAGTLAAKAATVGTMTGDVSIKHTWVRNATGAEGNASLASNDVTFATQVAQYSIVEPAPNGADRVRMYPSPKGFGKTGPSYFYIEKAVSSFRRTVVDGVTNGTTLLTSATAAWTAADVGATVTLSGGGSLTTTIASVTNSTDVVLNSAPGWSTSGNTVVVNDLIELDFSDADLQPRLAPIDHNIPPLGVWAFQLESVWVVVACYGDSATGATTAAPGISSSVSKVNRYEAFPADFIVNHPSAPTGLAQRASDAFVYVWSNNWLGAFSFTGGTPPVSFQVLWANTGFANQHSACIAEGGQLYGFSSKRGPIRITTEGEPDTEFANRIRKTVAGWTAANVVVGWDSDHTQVIFMHGSELLCFNTSNETWSAPIDISTTPVSVSGSVVSCATNGTSLAFSVNNSGTFTAYPFNTGTTGSTWESYSTWRTGGAPGLLKTVGPVRGKFKHDDATTNPIITTKIFKQSASGAYQTSSPNKTVNTTVTETGTQELPVIKSNVRNTKAFCLYQTGRALAAGSGESAPIMFAVDGTVNFVRK